MTSGSKILLKDRETQEIQTIIKKAHDTSIYDLAFNRNKPNQLITCSPDGTIKIWDLKAPRIPVKVFSDLNSTPLKVRLNPIYDSLLLSACTI